ncbi:MAG: hypothetical protein IJY11_02640 [Clostridia bacterium]|nr:hypothetical protein [Clostridia bacterium]
MKKFSIKKLLTAIFAGVCCACTGLSVALLDKEVETVSAATSGEVELYQLAPNKGWLMESYVIKTANNKLIVIDGGADGSDDDSNGDGNSHGTALTAEAYMPAALRAIAGVGEGEYFEVEAWFVSHGHKDHFNELGKMLSSYTASSNYKINNIYLDFPDFGGSYDANGDWDSYGPQFKAGLDNYAAVNGIATSGSYYDDINGAVINAENIAKGLDITVDGVRFEILQTWAADEHDFNSNSTVIRMHVGDQSVLFLNDLGVGGGNRLTSTYTTEELESDYVQMGHHGQTAVTQAHYTHMGATPESDTKYLWCSPLWTFSDATSHTVYQNYEWVNGSSYMNGTTFDQTLVDTTRNKVACLYSAYPATLTSVADWSSCVSGMKVASFAYQEVGFEVMGASVRTASPDGIRFVAQVNSEALTSYGAGAKYGVILVPEVVDTTRRLTVSYDGANYTTNNTNALVIEGGELWSAELCAANGVKDGYSAFSSALLAQQSTEEGAAAVEFPAEFYNTPITAVGFIIPESGNTIYTSKVTRSIAYVATVESLKSTYEENAVVEKIVAGADVELSVNGGQLLDDKSAMYAPVLKIGGMDAAASAAVNVTYTSDDESVIKIVDNKVTAVGDGIATVTATVSVDGTATLVKEVSVEAYVSKVTFDGTTLKVQAGANADVSFAFTSSGNAYTLKDGAGTELDTTAFSYENNELTLKGTYLSTLDVGLYTYTLSVADRYNSTFTFSVGVYGDADGTHLAFPASIYGVNNFDSIPMAAITEYLGSSAASGKPLYVDGADAAVVDAAAGSIDGQSLMFKTKAAQVAAEWNKLAILDLGFEKDVVYTVSLKAKITAPATGTKVFALRFDDVTAANSTCAFNVVDGSATGWSNVGNGSTVSLDSTTGVWTIKAVIAAPTAGATLNLTTVGDDGNGGEWTVVIDDLCITVNEDETPLIGVDFESANVGSYSVLDSTTGCTAGMYPGETYATGQVVDTDVISGTKSLKLTTTAAGETGNVNDIFKSEFGMKAGTRYLISLKFKFSTTLTSGNVYFRTNDGAINALKLDLTSGSTLAFGYAQDSATTLTYDETTGVYTANIYMTPSADNQVFALTKVGAAAWTFIVDDFKVANVTFSAKHIALDANDYELGATLASVFQAENSGPNLHLASGTTDGGVVDCGDLGNAFRLGANGVAIWFDKFAANTTYRFSIRFSVDGDAAISSLLLKWINDGGIDANWIKDNAVSGNQTTDTLLYQDEKGVWTWTCYLTSGATDGGQFVFYDVGNQIFNVYSIDIAAI